MKRTISWITRRKFTAATIGALLVILVMFVFRNGGTAPRDEVAVQRSTIIQEVTVTGKAKAVEEIDLAFEKSGRISRVPVAIGNRVIAGQILAELDRAELIAQLAEGEAKVLAEQAKYDELKRGTRSEDVQVKQTELKKAKQDLANQYQSVFDTVNDAYVKADDAVRKQVDDLFANDEEENPQLTFVVLDSQKEIDAEFKRRRASAELKTWKMELDVLLGHENDYAALDWDIQASKNHLLVIRDFLNKLMDATIDNANLPDATETTYKASITTARTNVAAALTLVSTQEQTISSQKLTVARINDELVLKLAGSTPEQIAAQEALLRQARASVQIIQAQLTKSTIRSPIAGVVTKQDAKPGEIAQANVTLISVISDDNLEIEANVPEADVAKIALHNAVAITFDAYGDEAFSGTITFIDPAETVIEGVPTYRTLVQLSATDPRIKPGLTANLEITAARRENALTIPQRSLIYRGDERFVLIATALDAPPEERKVTTGLRGSDGMIEIISGLSEGERIVSSPE